MQLIGINGETLGYYVDIDTPLRKVDGEYTLTDLILDLWVTSEGNWIELDRDEFEQAYKQGLLNSNQYKKANHVIDRLKHEIADGKFFLTLVH